MAKPLNRENLKWEEQMAMVSLAGVRPLTQTSVSPGASSEATYTITNKATKRVILAHTGADEDIRVDLNTTATASSFPIFAAVYFGLEVEPGDVVHLFNTSGAGIEVHILETR